MKIDNTVLPEKAAFALRLFVGVAFGLALAWLRHVTARAGIPGIGENAPPPAPWQPVLFSTLLLTAFVWWAGAGAVRRASLAAWGLGATVIIAFLAWYQLGLGTSSGDSYVFTAPTAFLVLPLLFIANELVSSGDRAGKVIAPYPTYFDQAWKRGVQLGLSLLFTGLFWMILWLGAALLGLIGFDWFKTLLGEDWFHWPACGAAMACAVQLGDVQDKLLVNVRAVVLSVLSWLLPVIAAIGLLFLGALCVSGLGPLWKTKAATMTLLGAAVIFVLLINAAYQQGDEERPVHIAMKWAARLACFLLLAFAGLAAWSLWLRIDQYGLTPERVLAGTGVSIAVLFGLGYTMAAAWPGRWLARLDRVNIAMAFVKVLIFLGLLTPVADPARLGVADQVARLQSGRTAPDHFDWQQLRFETGRHGTAALGDLAQSGRTANIRAAATRAQAWKDTERYEAAQAPTAPAVAEDIRRLKIVSPAGAGLPETFTAAPLDAAGLRPCLDDRKTTCAAAIVDLDGDGLAEIVVLKDYDLNLFRYVSGQWRVVPMAMPSLDEDGVKAFNAGQVGTQPHAWSDLKVGTRTLTVTTTENTKVRSQRWVRSTSPASR